MTLAFVTSHQKASRSCCTNNIAHLMLTTDALLESSSASVIVCLTCAQAKIPSMLAVDGHITRAQVIHERQPRAVFTLLLVTHAQAEAAERLKEMVLEDAKRADSCAPNFVLICGLRRASSHISTCCGYRSRDARPLYFSHATSDSSTRLSRTPTLQLVHSKERLATEIHHLRDAMQ